MEEIASSKCNDNEAMRRRSEPTVYTRNRELFYIPHTISHNLEFVALMNQVRKLCLDYYFSLQKERGEILM